MDIAAIDGVPCTVTAVDGPCGTMVRALASLPAELQPTELIFCFDADGPGPAFAAPTTATTSTPASTARARDAGAQQALRTLRVAGP